jgi:hypothetical protein
MNITGKKIGAGTRLQAGIPREYRSITTLRANGLMLRGVVVATYVTDDAGHPQADSDGKDSPSAVYCDVLVYSSVPGQRWSGLKNVLVAQERGGLHRGKIWKPRAATVSLTDELDQTSNPAYLDGDHVLISFLDNNFSQPIIIGGLPHPSQDWNWEEGELRPHLKLKQTDGDPELRLHHGITWGVNVDNNFIIDTTWANDGSLDDKGKESDPPTDGKGSQQFSLPQDSTMDIVFYDMTDSTAPDEVLRMKYQKDAGILDIKDAAGYFNVQIEDGASLKVELKDDAAKLTLGDGAVKAAVADHLEALYGTLKTWLEGVTVPTGTGPSGTPLNAPAPSWDSNINSDKLTLPDTG